MTKSGEMKLPALAMRARWTVKKATRRAWTLTASALGPCAPGARLRVLTYHRFGTDPHDAFCVSPSAFEEQMAWLASEGRAVSLDDAISFAQGERDLADGSVLVTIDDGCKSTHTIAAPLLERYRVPAVAFVSSRLIGRGRMDLPEPYMTWGEARECVSAGIELGSHSLEHRSLGWLPMSEAREEAARSRAEIEDAIGREVRAFAYPFGTVGDFDQWTDGVVRDAGYALAFHSNHGSIGRGDLAQMRGSWSLPRVKIEGGEPLWMFQRMADGAMDRWRWVDEKLWILQRLRYETALAPSAHP